MDAKTPSTVLPDTFSPSGEKAGMRGRTPHYGNLRAMSCGGCGSLQTATRAPQNIPSPIENTGDKLKE